MAIFQSVHDIIDYASNWGNCPKKKKRVLDICYDTLWSIWKARNERIFNNKMVCATKVADITKSITFVWFKYRSDNGDLNWLDWINYRLCNL